MAIGDDIGLPEARIKVWAPGQARPTVGLRETAFYDVLKESAGKGYGTFSTTSALSDLEYLPIGDDRGLLVCRPQLVLKDLQTTQVDTTLGTWEQRRPGGGDDKLRICQTDTTANVAWSARTKNPLPASPNFCASVFLADAPPDGSTSNFFRIEFGSSLTPWGLEWSRLYGGRLLLYDPASAAWVPKAELPDLATRGNDNNDESLVFVRYHRGYLLVSTDYGKSYTAFPGVVPGGRLTFRGNGGQATLGLHQLFMHSGTWTSPADLALSNAFTLLFTGSRYDSTNGAVTFTDLSVPASNRLQYSVGITAATGLGPLGWSFYYSSEAYAVLGGSAATQNIRSNGGLHDEAYTGSVLEFVVKNVVVLESEQATFSIRLDPDTDFSWLRGRLPECTIELGDSLKGLTRVFTGVIDLASAQTQRYRDGTATFTAYPVHYLLKLAKFGPHESWPRSGLTLNAALDSVFASECVPLNSAFRSWHPFGDAFILGGNDLAEHPFAWPREGESKWDKMREWCALAGLDLATDDYGVHFTLPLGYVSPVVTKTYEAVPTVDLTNLVFNLRWSLQGSESRTAVVVRGTGPSGELQTAWAVDDTSEQEPAVADRFTPVRLLELETLEGTCSPGMVTARAQALADQYFRTFEGVTLEHPVDLARNRRDQVRITGFTRVNVPTSLRFAIATLRHYYKADPSGRECTTTAGLRLRPGL